MHNYTVVGAVHRTTAQRGEERLTCRIDMSKQLSNCVKIIYILPELEILLFDKYVNDVVVGMECNTAYYDYTIG